MAKDRVLTVGKLRAWFASIAVAMSVSAVGASTASAVPANFWGMDPQLTPTSEQLQRVQRGGVESIRIPIPWSTIQLSSLSAPDWSGTDVAVRGAAEARLDILPFVYGAPTWAVPGVVVDSRNHLKAPSNLPVKTGAQRAAWATFLTMAIGRYGPNGSFWAENPTVPKRPLRTWQIWNEENFKYFVARPNPAEYGKLIKVSYTAIKGADPGAKIVLGGLFAEPGEALPKTKRPITAYFATDFLEQMYKATPGVKTKFSGVALHPYTGSYLRLTPDIEAVRAVLKASHDPAKSIWITELGWSSGHPELGNSFAKGLHGQATQLKGAFRVLTANQRKWHIQRVYWFSLDDAKGACNFCDGSGLFGAGFVPKPAWSAYVKFAGGTP
jgi:polysaccharide biosynthesis protein PslG